jgi:hypothetical protein
MGGEKSDAHACPPWTNAPDVIGLLGPWLPGCVPARADC